MSLPDWIRCASEDRALLLRDAHRVARRLPPPKPGSLVALAFGDDRRALAVSMVACWLRGHGAAVAENTLRERIVRVLEHPDVLDLLHDTGSGRPLQVPRLLAAPDTPDTPAGPDTRQVLDDLPSPMLAVDVQTEDGDQRWCTWSARELAPAIAAVASQPHERAAALATPGHLPSLFVDTLGWLRGERELAATAGRLSDVEVPGAPTLRSQHATRLRELRAQDGIDDAAAVHDRAGRPRFAVAGRASAALVAADADAYAVASIPRDPNGQPLRAELCLALGLGRDGQPVTRELAWTPLTQRPDEAAWRTEIPHDYLFYEGHFDGYPVLAGGVQLHELVLPRLRAAAGELPPLQQLDGVKFLARFVPGETVDLHLRRQPQAHKVTFELRRGETRCTTGRLQFTAPVAPLDGGAPA